MFYLALTAALYVLTHFQDYIKGILFSKNRCNMLDRVLEQKKFVLINTYNTKTISLCDHKNISYINVQQNNIHILGVVWHHIRGIGIRPHSSDMSDYLERIHYERSLSWSYTYICKLGYHILMYNEVFNDFRIAWGNFVGRMRNFYMLRNFIK